MPRITQQQQHLATDKHTTHTHLVCKEVKEPTTLARDVWRQVPRHALEHYLDWPFLKKVDFEGVIQGNHLQQPTSAQHQHLGVHMLTQGFHNRCDAWWLSNGFPVDFDKCEHVQAADCDSLNAYAGSKNLHWPLKCGYCALLTQSNLFRVTLVSQRPQKAAGNIPPFFVPNLQVLCHRTKWDQHEASVIHLHSSKLLHPWYPIKLGAKQNNSQAATSQ